MKVRNISSAFTLVELLVVIAILGILAALITRGGSTYINRAREARCASNLRQLYMGFTTYAADHNGRVPFGARDPDITDANSTYYEGVYAQEFKTYIPGVGGGTGYVEPYLCPADLVPRAGTRGWLGHSYGVNQTICGGQYNRMISWQHPSQTFLLTDSMKAIISRSSPAANLDPRHRLGANVLFCDGHAEWRVAPFLSLTAATAVGSRAFWIPDGQ